MKIESLLKRWIETPDIYNNFVYWKKYPAKEEETKPFPKTVHPLLKKVLIDSGISDLYTHQFLAFQLAQMNHNIGIITNTASGKSLSYNLPVLNGILNNKNQSALYLFPTKALSQDQFGKLSKLGEAIKKNANVSVITGVYDGDTPSSARKKIRDNANIIITNPDMLHYGILPNHTKWQSFFSNLRYVIIDESHIYRGVFGSHVSNIIRRLKRIVNFYGGINQYILTSATIGNPGEFFTRLIGADVQIIDIDGSPHGTKFFMVYNPPIKNKELGIRKSLKDESLKLSSYLYQENIQTIVFTRSRRFAEILLREHLAKYRESRDDTSSYRSGLLPKERRFIESQLKKANIKLVFSTNALELGIDIGDLSATIIAGYPGTIASVFQMSGRSGRKSEESSLTILITGSSPLEQYIARNPDFIFSKSPESALINPDNLPILVTHIEHALKELPFHEGERFGKLPPEILNQILQFEVENENAMQSGNKYYWIGLNQPDQQISLRNASQGNYLLQIMKDSSTETIGSIDEKSAFLFVHPGAIYLHKGEQYFVRDLIIEEKIAILEHSKANYYTMPQTNSQIIIVESISSETTPKYKKSHGVIKVSQQVIGYKKIDWDTGAILETTKLNLPVSEYQTTAYWFSLNKEKIDDSLFSSWLDNPIDYGPNWQKQRLLALQRDNFRCQVCNKEESEQTHLHVHHKIPFRNFQNYIQANDLSNLITLCPQCHRIAEKNVKIQSGLSGIAHAIRNLAPLFLMCDYQDIESGIINDNLLPTSTPAIVLYERIPGGIGFSEKLYAIHETILEKTYHLINTCSCEDGCPSCVGPGGENGSGGKKEALTILQQLLI